MDLLGKVQYLVKDNKLTTLETLYRSKVAKLGKITLIPSYENIIMGDVFGMKILRKDFSRFFKPSLH